MILSKERITNALIRMRRYMQAGLCLCFSQTPEDKFAHIYCSFNCIVKILISFAGTNVGLSLSCEQRSFSNSNAMERAINAPFA